VDYRHQKALAESPGDACIKIESHSYFNVCLICQIYTGIFEKGKAY
jgi:hypothetical protein